MFQVMNMATIITRHELGVRDVGSTVRVADDRKAKLMFYLKCICDVISLEIDEDMKRLTDFENFYVLTESETDQLTMTCLLLSPDVLMDKCIFHNERMCGTSQNEFFELASVQRQLVVSENLLIGGEQTRVKRVMCYKLSWLVENYILPMEYFKRRLDFRLALAQDIARRNEATRGDCCCTIL